MGNTHKGHDPAKIRHASIPEQKTRTKFPDELIKRVSISINKEIKERKHWKGAYTFTITEDEAKAVAGIGRKFKSQFLKKGKSYDEEWMRRQLKEVLQPKKLEGMAVFLSNFYNVFVKRYPEEGQLKYIQESLGDTLEYISAEPLGKLLSGKFPYWSWWVPLSQDRGQVSGAVGDANLARIKLGEQPRAKSMRIDYTAYICPDSPKEDEKMFPVMRRIANDMFAQAGKADWMLKEIENLDDFEYKAFSKDGMLAVPGLRYYDVFFKYWSHIEKPENIKDPEIYLLMKPLKGGTIKDGQGMLIRYDDLRDIVLWSYVYRGLEEVGLKDTSWLLYKYVDHALANVKTTVKDGIAYVKVVSLDECIALEGKA